MILLLGTHVLIRVHADSRIWLGRCRPSMGSVGRVMRHPAGGGMNATARPGGRLELNATLTSRRNSIPAGITRAEPSQDRYRPGPEAIATWHLAAVGVSAERLDPFQGEAG